MRLSLSLAIVAAVVVGMLGAAPAQAEDYRIQVKHSKQKGSKFCDAWRADCVNYVPKNDSLYFKGTLCEPGNAKGQYPYHHAQVFCLFTDGNSTVPVNKHIAKKTGAKIL